MTVNALRGIVSACAIAAAAAWLTVNGQAQAPDRTAITGAWTLNTDLSDKPPQRDDRGDRSGGDRSGGDTSRHGGGMGRGGGRGMGRGGGGGAAAPANPDDVARMRDAMRAVTNAPDHLTITQSETMVLMASQDGHTTRLAPDGKKIKEDNTGVERKSRWDGAKLVSEISGLGPGKITETYWVDDEAHRLHVTVAMEGRGKQDPVTMKRIYDLDPR